jgi:hypothetical protein
MTDADRIEARWRTFWHPRCVLRSNPGIFSDGSDALLDRYETIHAHAVEACLRARIPWRTIIKYSLDDPLVLDATRGARLAAAVERQRSRKHTVQRAVKRRLDNVLPR